MRSKTFCGKKNDKIIFNSNTVFFIKIRILFFKTFLPVLHQTSLKALKRDVMNFYSVVKVWIVNDEAP